MSLLIKAVGIPAYNEEKNIASIIIKLKKFFDIIIVCNDGSKDLTGSIAKEMNTIVINHEKNQGYGSAIRSILSEASKMEIDCLVTFDADGQHRIEDIEKIITPIKENKADIVIGSRFLQDHDSVPKYRKFGIKAITEVTNLTSGLRITDSQSGFRGYNSKAIKEIKPSESGMGISTEILIKAKQKKLRILEVPIIVSYDGDTSTHNSISHGSSVIISTLKLVSIDRPLTFYGIPGIVFICIGLIFGIWSIQIYLDEQSLVTNITIIGIGGIILGTVFLISATILYSLITVIKQKRD